MKYQLNRTCLVCSKQLIGRSDKIFCSLSCKNKYHSEIRKSTKSIVAETFKIINKNWQILTSLMTEKAERIRTKKLTLQRLGFDFNNVTNVAYRLGYLNFGIYNFTFYIAKNDTVIITKEKDYSEISPFLFKRLLQQFPLSE